MNMIGTNPCVAHSLLTESKHMMKALEDIQRPCNWWLNSACVLVLHLNCP